MKPAFLVVFLKEFKETLRDRRALVLLALFTLMYPLMLGYMLNQQIGRATRSEREGMELAVVNGAQAPNLMAQLKQKNITIVPMPEIKEEAIGELLRGRKVVALLRLDPKFGEHYQAMRPAGIELWYDSASDNSQRQRDIEEVLQSYSSNISSARLLAHGVSPATMAPVRLQRFDTGSTAARSAGLIGAILGFLFFPAFICGLSAAVDSTAGERERRSLEVLMAQPASPWSLIVGKWLAAGSLAVIGITLELALAHAVLSWLPLEEIGMSWRVTSAQLALVCLSTIPLSLFAAGLHIALAMNAKSFKEAQSMLSLVILLPMLPGVAVSVLDLKTATWMYLVPMLSNQTLLRELAKGQDLGALPFVLTFFSSMLPALGAVAFASWRMKSERYVLSV
ncbi:ABC transporter permease [Massilia antarctica]|uniref:ABC transporter permease n=1 Tax=Massilia antarctica TaxID=2765360 RepID=UPI0006BB6FCB|nr:ABC transporter permease [Massilia sp. H27-R4]MCY0916391.1 ABC transporter permease subunit [Massilia sp. H27-R4]CUI07356.1 ABC-type Na+ efflux pump, permease component [Janthinobacterium sp. CG23_2]CUU31142.1 ABC-type Na+ efflux pump, permease component [Janthinobacterium sp. CG23_2]